MILEEMAPSALDNPATTLAQFVADLDAFDKTMFEDGLPAGAPSGAKILTAATCIHIISETLACLPFGVFEVKGDQRVSGSSDRALRIHRLIDGKPNPFQTALQWREGETGKMLGWGAGRSEIEYSSSGEVLRLWPIPAHRIRKEVIDGKLVYVVNVGGGFKTLEPHQVFEIPWWAEGHRVYSPLRLAARYLQLADAMERFALKFFGEGSYISGFVTHPGKLTDSAYKRIRSSLESLHQGLDRAHRFALLDEGMTHSSFMQPLEETQLAQSRVFNDERIGALYRISPDRINYLQKASYASLDATEQRFTKDAIQPAACRWERAVDDQLLERWGSEAPRPRRNPQPEYSRMNLAAALRGDPKVQAEVLGIQRSWGVINADEWRALLEMGPQEGGQGKPYLVPENMRPASLPYPEKRGGDPGQAKALAAAVAGAWRRIAARRSHPPKSGATKEWLLSQASWAADQIAEAMGYFGVKDDLVAEVLAARALDGGVPPGEWSALAALQLKGESDAST